MARAGFCASCGENVWLAADGTCPRGHGADQISNQYEAAAPGEVVNGWEQPTQAQAVAGGQQPDPQQKRKLGAGAIVAIVLGSLFVLLLCCVVVGFVAIFAPSNAKQKSCYANERTIEGAAQNYAASGDGSLPSAISDLVPDYIKTDPSCPAGGSYDWDSENGTVNCSVHGNYSNPKSSSPITLPKSSSNNERSCFANQRTIDGAIQTYIADTDTQPSGIDILVPDYIKSMPSCPDSGETYTLNSDGNAVNACSVHGHY